MAMETRFGSSCLRMAMELWKLKRFGTEAEDVDAASLLGATF